MFHETGLLHQGKTRWDHYYYLRVGKCQLMSMRVSLYELQTNLQIFSTFNGPKYVMLPEDNQTPHFLSCSNYEVGATLVTRGSNSDN